MSIAEKIIQGNRCDDCGMYIFDKNDEIDDPGHPQTCSDCKKENKRIKRR